MAGITQQQFLLARHGISITESLMLPDFERIALVNLALEYERQQVELAQALSGVSHLAK